MSPLHRDASTVMEHVDAFRRYSRFWIWNVNTQEGIPTGLHGLQFAAVVLHYSLFAAGGYHLDDDFRSYLASECEGSYKVAFFQDEHHYCRDRFSFLNEYGFDCVYSCFEPARLDEVYGKHTGVPKLVSNIPGYMSEEMVEAARRFSVPDEHRPVDIGYRGRPLPPYMGRGGLEKHEIGVRFVGHAKGLDLRFDIACDEEDRIYGDDWYRFIAGCRAVLGTESGVSVVDLDDEVLAEYTALAAQGPVMIEQLERGALGRLEGRIPYRTISPRHFEAAALGVCQILYEGRYSGAMEPMVHYIPLRKDFSNFDEVIERFRDVDLRRELTQNARRDLIESGAYSYRTFISGLDETFTEAGLSPEISEADAAFVERALRRGRVRRRVRSQLWGLQDDLRGRDFPGRAALKPLVKPALRQVDRLRRASRT